MQTAFRSLFLLALLAPGPAIAQNATLLRSRQTTTSDVCANLVNSPLAVKLSLGTAASVPPITVGLISMFLAFSFAHTIQVLTAFARTQAHVCV